MLFNIEFLVNVDDVDYQTRPERIEFSTGYEVKFNYYYHTFPSVAAGYL